MIYTKVIKRYIQTLPIQDAIIRTDHLSEIIRFELVNWLEGQDLGAEGWQWFIYYRTTVDPPVVTPLKKNITAGGDTVYLDWEIDHNFTKRSGNLDFQIRGKRDTESGLVEWNSSVASINIGTALDPDNHDTDENILEWYLDRMEQLAQSGVADIIAERERALAAEAELRQKIHDETIRAQLAEYQLQEQITALEQGSADHFKFLDDKINREIERATNEETVLKQTLKEETDRAIEAEVNLDKAIKDETTRAKKAESDNTVRIVAEINRAMDEEARLNKALTDETLRALQAEQDLNTGLATEIQRATQAEEEIRQTTSLQLAEITKNLDDEINRALTSERNLNESIESEYYRAQEAERILGKRISDETTRATKAEKALDDKITQSSSDLTNLINQEAQRAQEAEAQLQENLDTEVQRATQAEELLQSNIDAEIQRATQAEANLNTKIEAETTRATQSETLLQSNIDKESTRAQEAESALDVRIEAETQRATKAESDLDAKIDQTKATLETTLAQETTTRTQEDQKLAQQIEDTNTKFDAEVVRLDEADANLNKRIDEVSEGLTADIQTLVGNLNNEISRSTTKDGEHDNAIQSLRSDLTAEEEKLDLEIARSTEQDEKLTAEVGSLVVKRQDNPTASVSARYTLVLTRDGSETQRGVPIDIPVTDAVTGGRFEDGNLILILANGDEISVPIGDLVQYYNAGDGLQLTKEATENTNKFSVKLDTATGTQGILGVSPQGIKIDLSKYYTSLKIDELLKGKQTVLRQQNPDPENPYLPSILIDSSNMIYVNERILADLGIAYAQAEKNQINLLQVASTTINGKKISRSDETGIYKVDLKLYQGNLVDGQVLIASGVNGDYKASGFTIKKSVPADAKFTDTLYYPVSESIQEGLFTWAEKQKLAGIAPGAEVNVQSDWNATEGDAFIKNKPVDATPEKGGFLSAADKTKLDGIAAGAEVNQNAFSSVTDGGATLSASSKTDVLKFVGAGGTTVTVNPETKEITITSKQTDQPDWTQEDTSSPAYIKNRPDWVKNANKPTYTPDEVGALPITGGTLTGGLQTRETSPSADNTYSLGTPTSRYKRVHVNEAILLGTDEKGIFYNAETGGFDFIC